MLRNTSTHAVIVNNLGPADRVGRVLLAGALLAPAFAATGAAPLGWLTLPVLASVYPAVTAIMGWDPLYQLLRVSTVPSGPAPIDATRIVEALVQRYHGNTSIGRVGATNLPAEPANVLPQEKRAA